MNQLLQQRRSLNLNWIALCNAEGQRATTIKLMNCTHPVTAKGAYSLLLINDIIYARIVDLRDVLVKAGLFRFLNKKMYNSMLTEINRYNKSVWERMRERNQLFSDIADEYSSFVDNAIEMFRINLRLKLSKILGEDKNLDQKTQCILLYFLISFSTNMCTRYQQRMAEVIEVKEVYALEYLSLEQLRLMCYKFIEQLCGLDAVYLLCKDKSFETDLLVLCKSLNNSSYIAKAIEQGCEDHPENDEDWALLNRLDEEESVDVYTGIKL